MFVRGLCATFEAPLRQLWGTSRASWQNVSQDLLCQHKSFNRIGLFVEGLWGSFKAPASHLCGTSKASRQKTSQVLVLQKSTVAFLLIARGCQGTFKTHPRRLWGTFEAQLRQLQGILTECLPGFYFDELAVCYCLCGKGGMPSML